MERLREIERVRELEQIRQHQKTINQLRQWHKTAQALNRSPEYLKQIVARDNEQKEQLQKRKRGLSL